MRDENAILATSIELAPGADDVGDVVVLDGERRLRLPADDPRSSGFRAVLRQLRDQRRPVYVEVGADGDTVDRLMLPLPTRVVRVEEGDRELLVEVVGSHAVHRVDLSEPGADDLAGVLREALASRGGVLLVEDDLHRVIDVEAFIPGPDGPVLPPFPKLPLEPLPQLPWWLRFWTSFWDWFWNWFWWWRWWRCPSTGTAQLIFDRLAAETCDPLTVPAPCIPFRYPDDGCWARATQMCRLMFASGYSPRKVWIRRSAGNILHVNTRNHPQCFVEWWYHVAPTLCVRTGSWWWPFSHTRMVMDPSMFTTPVPLATWKAAQNEPGASLEHTGAEQYWPSGGTDPAYTSTSYDLATYRTALLTRSIQVGPPPYASCP